MPSVPKADVISRRLAKEAAAALLALWACSLVVGGTPDANHPVEPPIAGRPANFSGAIGTCRVTTHVNSTELQAEDPIHLTVRVIGSGSLADLPRPDLRHLPAFARQFHIENLADRSLGQENAREFDYLLRPKNSGVKEIPPLPFVFFKPGLVPDYKGYQTTYAPAILLTVKSRARVTPKQIQGPDNSVKAPDSIYTFAEGSTVLRHQRVFFLPGPFALAALLVLPIVPGLAWYVVWRYRFPDEARMRQMKRSRAARQALKTLQRLDKTQPKDEAPQAAAAVLGYLRNQLDFAPAEPTPSEVAALLKNAGSSMELIQKTRQFLEECEAARFAPGLHPQQNGWSGSAIRLVLGLEAEQWPAAAS
ncbi:MAG TPA: BatD family protein [Gemmataceae bacterium]|nr:BatD family protein [Gemmataceae bacterium]